MYVQTKADETMFWFRNLLGHVTS